MKAQLCQGCREGRHSDHYSLPLIRADGTKRGECRCDRCVKTSACLCTHPQARHRGDTDSAGPVGCLDCVCELFELADSTPTERPVKTYKPHPAAELFPMMSSAELDELAADIAANGQHEPITLTSANLVLDGRNRLEACKRANVDPVILMWDREDDGISPTAWVISKNLHRRHLNPGQISLVAADSLPLFQEEAKARQKAGAAKGGEAPKVSAPGRTASAPVQQRAKPVSAASIAAKAVGVGTRSVERAKAVIATAPKAEVEKIRTGEKTLKQVERETKRATQVAQVRVYQPPAGEFGVISADPPWQYEDTLEGSDAVRGGCPYPTMPLAQICALKPPAAKDCILWLWTTNAFLADGSAAQVVRAWGFEAKTILTWIKPRIGVGRWLRNNTEHCILATRGSPVVELTNEPTMMMAPAGEHSAKPDLFYRMVEKLCPSPSRIEMFARTDRKGWTTTGAELGKKRLDGKESELEEPTPAPAVAQPPQPGRKGRGLKWRTAHDGDHLSNGRKVSYTIVVGMAGARVKVAGEVRGPLFPTVGHAKDACDQLEDGWGGGGSLAEQLEVKSPAPKPPKPSAPKDKPKRRLLVRDFPEDFPGEVAP